MAFTAITESTITPVMLLRLSKVCPDHHRSPKTSAGLDFLYPDILENIIELNDSEKAWNSCK